MVCCALAGKTPLKFTHVAFLLLLKVYAPNCEPREQHSASQHDFRPSFGHFAETDAPAPTEPRNPGQQVQISASLYSTTIAGRSTSAMASVEVRTHTIQPALFQFAQEFASLLKDTVAGKRLSASKMNALTDLAMKNLAVWALLPLAAFNTHRSV